MLGSYSGCHTGDTLVTPECVTCFRATYISRTRTRHIYASALPVRSVSSEIATEEYDEHDRHAMCSEIANGAVVRTISQADWDALDACIWSTVASDGSCPEERHEDEEYDEISDDSSDDRRRIRLPSTARESRLRPAMLVPCYAYDAKKMAGTPTVDDVLDIVRDNAAEVVEAVMKTPEAGEAVLAALKDARGGAAKAIVDCLARDEEAVRALGNMLFRSAVAQALEDLLASQRGQAPVAEPPTIRSSFKTDAVVVRLHGMKRGHNRLFSSECMGKGGGNISAMRERNDIKSPIVFDDDSGDGYTTMVRCIKGATAPHVDAIAAYVEAKAVQWLSGYPSTMGVTASYKGRALFEVWGDGKE